ncbi:MAG: hypothetical protein ABFS43_05455 [Thermodesulfobacteriota bacterium]
MIKFYINRELSESLGIRLSKWKRWSREFLPPDPLGGLQSGYARQYTIDQAFTVFWGGHLVAHLHFSMPEAQKIIGELKPWIKDHKAALSANTSKRAFEDTLIYIFCLRSPRSGEVTFAYLERNRLSDRPYEKGDPHARQEVYIEKPIRVASASNGLETLGAMDRIDSRILYISQLYERFLNKTYRLS